MNNPFDLLPKHTPEVAETPLESTEPVTLPAAPEIPFRATESMCRVKARLHSRFEPSATVTSISALSIPAIVKLTGSSSVSTWAKSHPGFLSWLTSEDWFDEKISWLEYLALNAAEDILLNEDPRAASAKLSAAKLILELSGKIRVKRDGVAESVDKSGKNVQNLSDDELVKIINVTKKIS